MNSIESDSALHKLQTCRSSFTGKCFHCPILDSPHWSPSHSNKLSSMGCTILLVAMEFCGGKTILVILFVYLFLYGYVELWNKVVNFIPITLFLFLFFIFIFIFLGLKFWLWLGLVAFCVVDWQCGALGLKSFCLCYLHKNTEESMFETWE